MPVDIERTKALLKRRGKLAEVYEVTRFGGYREDKRGVMCEITIEVWDQGGDSDPATRYIVLARDNFGRQPFSRNERSVERAIAAVDWAEFDRGDDD